MIQVSCFGKTIFWSKDQLISFILATDFVDKNEVMQIKTNKNFTNQDSPTNYVTINEIKLTIIKMKGKLDGALRKIMIEFRTK